MVTDILPKKKVILFAILNWGLGHASRSVPIIKSALENNNKVIIASDGLALELLKREFPLQLFETLPPYNVHYRFKSMEVNMAIQGPKIAMAMNTEKKQTQKLIKKHTPDLIISDNRYGCYDDHVHSIIMTHQLKIRGKYQWASKLASDQNYRMLEKFDEVWIPDYLASEFSLAGELSHPEKMPNVKFKYIGPLSRFKHYKSDEGAGVLFIVSGPEPQRTNFEKMSIDLAERMSEIDFILVRGTTTERDNFVSLKNLKVVDIADANQLQKLINHSKIVVCRSGYSSIMDLAESKKQVLIMPTPGQPEQEYLAQFHLGKSMFTAVLDGPDQILNTLKSKIQSYI